LKHLSTTN